jgi:hypothetical protein
MDKQVFQELRRERVAKTRGASNLLAVLSALALVLAAAQAAANSPPPLPRPPPPPPPGPAAAAVRGLWIERVYNEWHGPPWLVVIKSCQGNGDFCSREKLAGCLITGVNDVHIRIGDVAAVVAADAAAGAAPLGLMLDRCGERRRIAVPP